AAYAAGSPGPLSFHVKKRIARQQHLAEIDPDFLRSVFVLFIHALLSRLKPARRSQLSLTGRSTVRQAKRPLQPLLRVRFFLLQPASERLRSQSRKIGVEQRQRLQR